MPGNSGSTPKTGLGSLFRFNLFAARQEEVDEQFARRLDTLGRGLPGTLPRGRLFKH